MIVAVLDDGVNDCFCGGIGPLAFDLEMTNEGKVARRAPHDRYARSHGTICAAIIRKYAPSAEIGSLKVLDESTKTGSRGQLVRAVRWCAENGVPVIHTSLGSTSLLDYDGIRRAVVLAKGRGAIMVSAQSNSMKYSVPACLLGVIGVRHCSLVCGEELIALEAGLYEAGFAACGSHELTDYEGKVHHTPECNSYAAPVATAHAVRVLEREPGLPAALVAGRLGGKLASREDKLANTCRNRKNWTTPVAGVVSEKAERALWAAHCISRELARMGFSCLTLSDLPGAGSYHIDYFPADYAPKYALGNEDYYREPEVFVFASQTSRPFFDIQVSVSGQGTKPVCHKRSIIMPPGFRMSQIRQACRWLADMDAE